MLGNGLATGLVCALTGSALGAAGSPPLVRTTVGAAGTLVIGSVLLLVVSASPANAAVRDAFSSDGADGHFPLLPLLAVLPLVVAGWWTSARAAGRVGAGTGGQESG